MAHPTFRNRDDETDLVLHGLTTVGGNGFWLVIAPPQLGKSWFLGNVTTMLKEHGGWEVAWVDVRDYPGASRADSLAVLGRFFGLDSPAGDEAALTRLIAQRIVAGGKPYLCLLDSADLLPEPTAASLRRHFSEIYRLVQNAGRPGIRLALIVASRKGDEWRGVRPVPRLTLLRLTEFKADVVRHALRDLALQMDRDFNEAELGRFAALLLGLSEGLPELLMECLRWIKSEQWVDVDWLAGPQAFERLGRPYVRNWLLSHDSLQPADPELDAQRQRALEHALRVLAPYRLFTQSHLRHHWELDQDLANALAAVDWSMEDLWDAVSGTAVLTRPLDEPWQVMQPAIRRLLFRYFYRSDTERADAHLLARDFAKRWSEAQDTEQVIGVIECLWHELSALIYSGDGNIEERLCESARELVGSLQQSNLFTERELRESGQRRLIDDEEFQEAVSSIPRLIDRLIQIVAETEGRSK